MDSSYCSKTHTVCGATATSVTHHSDTSSVAIVDAQWPKELADDVGESKTRTVNWPKERNTNVNSFSKPIFWRSSWQRYSKCCTCATFCLLSILWARLGKIKALNTPQWEECGVNNQRLKLWWNCTRHDQVGKISYLHFRTLEFQGAIESRFEILSPPGRIINECYKWFSLALAVPLANPTASRAVHTRGENTVCNMPDHSVIITVLKIEAVSRPRRS